MTPDAQPSAEPIFDWEAAGRALGASLDRLHAIAILGSNETETAQVALGVARHQSKKRRVAVADLLGDDQPLQQVVPLDDPHGIADVFEYGVSIDKVARKVDGEDNLFLLPAGTFLTDPAEVMANRRWSRLAAGFREEKALLIIAGSVGLANIEALVLQLDGAVLVGNMVPSRLPVARVLGAVRGPHTAELPAKKSTDTGSRPKYVIRAPMSLWKIAGIVTLVVALIAAALGIWVYYKPFARFEGAPEWVRYPMGRDSVPLIVHGVDTAGVAGADSMLATARYLGLYTRADSAAQSPYGIALVTFNTRAGALLELRRNGATLRAGTFTPVLIRETPWFRVVAGAYPDSASAAALLDTLRARGSSDAGRAVIERFPYALLVERNVPDSAVAPRVSAYQTRGLPVYALLQNDGTARLFAGAFKAPAEALQLYDVLNQSGIQTSLVYRTGRVY